MKKTLRICILGPAYPYKGGIAAFNERLASELMAYGHHVDILTYTLQYPKFLFPGQSQMSSDPAPEQLQIKRGIHSMNPINWAVQGLKYRGQYDLIITEFWLPVMGVSLASIIRLMRAKKGKVIALVHNLIPHEKRPGDKWFTKYFMHSADAYMTMSKKVKADVEAMQTGKEVTFVAHPIYDSYGDPIPRSAACQHLGLDPDLEYVLFFGYIRKYKGLDLLMEAFAKAQKQRKQLRLLVAGEFYTDEAAYQEQIDALGIRDQVILRNAFISNAEVKYYFSAADLVAQTYRSATQSGISQLAIHFEKPLLSTHVGGLPETVREGKTGYLVPVDTDAIAEAMLRFVEEKRAEAFSEEVRIFKKEFAWSTYVDRLLELYQNTKR